MHRLNENKEEPSAAAQIKVWLYLHLSEQQLFFAVTFLPLSAPQHCPYSKMTERRQRSGFYHELVFHPPWLKCKATPPPRVREHEQRGEGEKRVENGKRKKKKNTTQTLWDVSFVSLSDCSSVGVYVALLSDGDLLTCRDREKRLTARSLCCSATLNRPWGGARKTTREKERDVGVLCIKVQREKKKKKRDREGEKN